MGNHHLCDMWSERRTQTTKASQVLAHVLWVCGSERFISASSRKQTASDFFLLCCHSQAAAALTASWAAYENGDQMLEVLALLYESVVVGGGRGRHHSQWAPYICTLPLEYSLPLNFT